ncbi:peptidase C45 [Rhizobium sp. ARZ01]|uniref:C45 family autoproteolytic acyltransferase/hydolase n=1 Tax=Rhizobium sp. ARZ01 TaxID=2769313 RepID=UPI0017811324|nr:C45 family peptidase [Rhizobium sp. ARZ01]MBD9372945.1 peptidase C45 [Rhizobium sp. ARZ01]
MVNTTAPRLPMIEIEGTPYEVGVALGRHGRETIHGYLLRTHAWASVLAFRDSARVAAARALTEARFPRYWQELHGLADGLELPFDDVFTWNCRGDVRAMSPDGCTTILLPGEMPTVAHNEDGDPGLRPGSAIARIRSEGGCGFTAFVYPGSIPCHTFALNDAGLAVAINNIRSKASGDGLPRNVLGRAMLDCTSIAEATELLRQSPRAGGFHFSLLHAGDPTVTSVEFTHGSLSVRRIDRPTAHANHLIHEGIRDERQIITDSSLARQERADELLEMASSPIAPLPILWDQGRPALPIYREQPDDPDVENTLATAVFTVGGDRIICSIHDQANTPPLYRIEEQRAI